MTLDGSEFGENLLHGNGGTFEADNITITVSDSELDTAGVEVLTLGNLTLTKDTTLTGENGSELCAEGNFSVNGTLTISGGPQNEPNAGLSLSGQNGSSHTMTGDVKVDFGFFDVDGGVWNAENSTVTIDAGDHNYGSARMHVGLYEDSANIVLKNLVVNEGKVDVVNGSLTTAGLTVAQTSGELTQESEAGVEVIIGGTGNTVSVSGGSVTVKNNGTFEIGRTLADGITISNEETPIVTAEGFAEDAFTLAGGTLKLDLSEKELTIGQINALKNALIADDSIENNLIKDGWLDIGDAEVNLDFEEGVLTAESAASIKDIVTKATQNATVEAGANYTGQAGALQTSGSAATVSGNVKLNGNDTGNYVADADGTVRGISTTKKANVSLADQGGNVGAISLKGEGSSFTVNAANQVIVQGKVEVSGDAAFMTATTVNDTVSASGDLSVQNTLNIGGNAVTASGSLNLSGAINFTADETTAQKVTISAADADLDKAAINDERADITLSGDSASTVTSSDIVADSLTVSGDLSVDGGSYIKVNTLTAAKDKDVAVGSDETGTAQMYVGTLSLNGADLIVDPEWDEATAIFAAESLNDKGASDSDMVLNGNGIVGRNAAVVIGLGEDAARAAVAKFQVNGKLSADGIGALMYVNKQVKIADDKGIHLATEHVDESTAVSGDTITLDKGTALVITDAAVAGDTAAFVFQDATSPGTQKGTLAGNGGEIILDGKFYDKQSITIATKQDGTDVDVTGEAIKVSTLNGILSGTITAGNSAEVDLTLSKETRSILGGASDPLYAAMMKTFDQDYMKDHTGLGVDYLSKVASNSNTGVEVDTAARLAVFGGAVQAALMAQQTSTDAVSSRMGMANRDGNMIYADNETGGGLWFVPVYKNHDSDEFDADGIDYGADIDLYGAALGADFTTASGVRVGGYFNVGSGEADGQGSASTVSNDFDYYGLGLYAGMNFGNFALTADVGFTEVSNDLDADSGNTGFGKLTADTDTTTVTVGLEAQYKFSTVVDVMPHLGLRYTSLSMDDYNVKSAQGVIASTDADNHSIVSIPFGVSVAKDFAAGNWMVKPVLDVTVTANCGDTEFDSDTNFVGFGTVATSAEVMDDWTYGGSLGLQAKYGDSLSLGVNVNYVGSSSADEFGVTGDVRYMF